MLTCNTQPQGSQVLVLILVLCKRKLTLAGAQCQIQCFPASAHFMPTLCPHLEGLPPLSRGPSSHPLPGWRLHPSSIHTWELTALASRLVPCHFCLPPSPGSTRRKSPALRCLHHERLACAGHGGLNQDVLSPPRAGLLCMPHAAAESKLTWAQSGDGHLPSDTLETRRPVAFFAPALDPVPHQACLCLSTSLPSGSGQVLLSAPQDFL